LDTCAFGTIFGRNIGELKAGKKRQKIEKKTTKSFGKAEKINKSEKN
jgi:hypothetical protein